MTPATDTKRRRPAIVVAAVRPQNFPRKFPGHTQEDDDGVQRNFGRQGGAAEPPE